MVRAAVGEGLPSRDAEGTVCGIQPRGCLVSTAEIGGRDGILDGWGPRGPWRRCGFHAAQGSGGGRVQPRKGK